MHIARLAVVLPALALAAIAAEPASIGDAFAQGKLSLNARLRYEQVEQTNLLDARALTLRTRLGFTTAKLDGVQFGIEFENVATNDGDSYSQSGLNPAAGPRAVVADPETTELNQLWLGLTYVIIAHDLSVIRQVSDRTAVMYLGSIVELGPTDEVYRAPAHPYTQALISAVPVPDVDRGARSRIVLAGDVPSPIDPPAGCRFHPRCRFAQDRCRRERPALREIASGRAAACHFPLTDAPSVSPLLQGARGLR